MKPLKTFYNNQEIKTIFTLPENKVDLHIGKNIVKNINKSELMVKLVDVENIIKEYKDKIEQIKEITLL